MVILHPEPVAVVFSLHTGYDSEARNSQQFPCSFFPFQGYSGPSGDVIRAQLHKPQCQHSWGKGHFTPKDAKLLRHFMKLPWNYSQLCLWKTAFCYTDVPNSSKLKTSVHCTVGTSRQTLRFCSFICTRSVELWPNLVKERLFYFGKGPVTHLACLYYLLHCLFPLFISCPHHVSIRPIISHCVCSFWNQTSP